MTKEQVIALLLEETRRAGSQKEWCRAHGISEQYVSDVLKGRRDVGNKVLEALGYRKVVIYEKAA